MKDILEYISTWSVLKWIVAVLIAGFIGHFGRMMAEAIVRMARQHSAGKSQLPNEGILQSDAITTTAPESVKPESSSTRPDTEEKPGKKLIKAMAKSRKKKSKNK
jgi:hypothetical protein